MTHHYLKIIYIFNSSHLINESPFFGKQVLLFWFRRRVVVLQPTHRAQPAQVPKVAGREEQKAILQPGRRRRVLSFPT